MARPGPGSESRLLPKVAPAPSPRAHPDSATPQTPRTVEPAGSQRAAPLCAQKQPRVSGLTFLLSISPAPSLAPTTGKEEEVEAGFPWKVTRKPEATGSDKDHLQHFNRSLHFVGGWALSAAFSLPRDLPASPAPSPSALQASRSLSSVCSLRSQKHTQTRRQTGSGRGRGGKGLFQEHHLDVQSIITITPRHGQLSLCNLQLTG